MIQVRERRRHQTKVLALTGQFNRDTTTGIQARILGAKEMGCHHIILDFSDVTEIDSTSLRELFLWYRHMKPYNVEVSVVKPSPYIRYHSDWVPLAEIVSIYASEDEAMEQAESIA
jgi:anti-anti-sigma factor